MATAQTLPAARAARLLGAAGFTAEGVSRRVGRLDDLPPLRDIPVYLRRLGPPDELGVLVRLLLLELDVAAEEAERLVRADLLDALNETGLVREADGRVRPRARLTPHDDLLIASDVHGAVPTRGFVPGVQAPSRTLVALTPRIPVERALDVGTGSGYLALRAARHAEVVVATDVSEGALAFARLNAALNGVANLQTRAGSFFDPVVGEEFDLVVCNPPYVISPESEFVFRDGGLGRDAVSEHVVRSLPGYVRPGGYAAVLIAWVENGGEAPRSWLAGSGCDAWLFRTWSHDALAAAATWNADELDPEPYERRVARWLDYYEREGIESIGYGALVVRRRAAGEGWFREVTLSGRPTEAPGQIERLFTGPDTAAETDEELLRSRFRPAPEAVLVREMRADGVSGSIRLDTGIRTGAAVDERTAALIEALASGRTLSDSIAHPAERSAAVGVLRGLLAAGFVERIQ